jgi:hypothetical protein
VPLLDCLDREGRICGNSAALLLERKTNGKPGPATVTVPVTDPKFFADPRTAAWLAAVAQRIDAGVFLFEGGTDFYTVFENETLPVGALIANRRARAAAVGVEDGKSKTAQEKRSGRKRPKFPQRQTRSRRPKPRAPWARPARGHTRLRSS